MSTEFRDNPALSRYELDVDGTLAFATYRRSESILVIPHVEAAPPLRGTGAAGRLLEEVMAAARRDGVKVRPLCSYAAAWMRRHSEHHDLLA